MLIEYLGYKIIGKKWFAYVNNLEDLVGKFTTLRCHKILIYADELGTWSGDGSAADTQLIKRPSP